ncbi:hypothetical protein L1049_024971 [Liquidambar formosana]|uniref:Neprosin PEP catalytic domain-containing protein n=1 Tax=Liquidambar formosana TaxID=63359 RepID=A0AAP0S2T5_LIQFO
MGSGHFLEEGVGKSSCFRNIQIVDASNNVKVPKGIGTFTEQSNCYDVQTGSNGDWGHSVYYGGPGKCKSMALKSDKNCQLEIHVSPFNSMKISSLSIIILSDNHIL